MLQFAVMLHSSQEVLKKKTTKLMNNNFLFSWEKVDELGGYEK